MIDFADLPSEKSRWSLGLASSCIRPKYASGRQDPEAERQFAEIRLCSFLHFFDVLSQLLPNFLAELTRLPRGDRDLRCSRWCKIRRSPLLEHSRKGRNPMQPG